MTSARHERFSVPSSAESKRRRMRDDVRSGLLLSPQKELPPTYFYDAVG